MQVQAHALLTVGPPALDQHRVVFFDPSFAQFGVQRGERAALLCQQQHARSIAVEAMHEFEKARLRPLRAQLFDDAEAYSAASVDCQAGRFVKGEQAGVLEQDGAFKCRIRGRRRARSAFGHPHGRNAQLVAASHTVVGLGPPAVDANFAAAQYAIDVTFGHAFEQLHQIIVDPLSAGLFADLVSRYGIFAQTLHFAYTNTRLADFRTGLSGASAVYRGKRRR